MNVTFNILWFEDAEEWYEMEKNKLEEFLKEHALKPNIERRDGDDFEISTLQNQNFDLIIMDFQLNDITGDKIASVIRGESIFTDLLFYSSNEDAMYKAVLDCNPPLDGVFYCKRDNELFFDKAKTVIKKIIRRSEDVVNLRGVVLDNTSNFETRIKKIISCCWRNFDDSRKKAMFEKSKKELEQNRNRINKSISKIEDKKITFLDLNDDSYSLHIANRLKILELIIDFLSSDDISLSFSGNEFYEFYVNNITKPRNKLGHVENVDNTIFIDGEKIELDGEFHKNMRKSIQRVDCMLEEIEKYCEEAFNEESVAY